MPSYDDLVAPPAQAPKPQIGEDFVPDPTLQKYISTDPNFGLTPIPRARPVKKSPSPDEFLDATPSPR
jgi:hypothetical protein